MLSSTAYRTSFHIGFALLATAALVSALALGDFVACGLADARAFDDDAVEATAVGQRTHLDGRGERVWEGLGGFERV